MKTYYEILGIPRGATREEIQLAFRRLAQVHHPDKGGSAEAFASISEAYEILSHTETRALYDRHGTDPRKLPKDLANKAADQLAAFMAQIIESAETPIERVNFRARLEGLISDGVPNLRSNERTAEAFILRYDNALKRLRRIQGFETPILEAAVLKQRERHVKMLDDVRSALALAGEMRELLKNYEYLSAGRSPDSLQTQLGWVREETRAP